jgi:hypothetical protein
MIVHQAVGVAEPVKPVTHLFQGGQKHLPVTVVSKYCLSFVTPGSEVIERAIVFDP